uniref:Glycosyltransferase family 1 protein n=1 Tax=candidate division CPR3 bacterium TaxID=2268181 RepID=A0A7V3J9G0_UNCC3
MKIGIDARYAVWQTRGIGRYTRELLQCYAQLDKTNEYFLYLDRPDVNQVLPQAPNFHVRILKPEFWPIFEQFLLVKASLGDGIDLLHAPGVSGPIFVPKKIKYVITIHDIMFLKPILPTSPILRQRLGNAYRGLAVPPAVARADAIITDSEAQKEDVVKILGKDRDKIKVIHIGIDEFVAKRQKVLPCIEAIWNNLKQKYEIKGRFIFTVGGTAPQHLTKNVIDCFAAANKEPGFEDLQLVICGLMGQKETYLHKYASQLGLEGKVIFTDYISDEELIAFYTKTSVFIHFLLTDGFELPIIEALSCGTPSIFSNTPPIPELYEGAGVIVDHFNIEQVKKEIISLISDSRRAEELKHKGLEKASTFTSRKMASETLELYASCVESKI